MQITREDLNPCTIQLNVVCEPDEVKEGYNRAFKKIAKKIRLPGFRPGHAPRSIVQQYVDPGELNQTAAEEIVGKAYKAALEKEEIEPDPNTRPFVDLTKLEEAEAACEFTVKLALAPKAELGEYKGVFVERPKVDVSEDEVDYQLEELRKRRSTREAVTERGVEEGDIAVVNVRPDGEEGEGRNFMTVAGKTFPQLDNALMGMHLEEMKNLDLTFPENFQEKDWAGKSLHCQVTLNSVSTVKLPPLDDSFAQTFQTESVEDLRGRIRKGVEGAKSEMVRQMVAERLIDKVLELSTVHVSDVAWEQLAARRVQETEEEQKRQGKTLEQYAQENGMSLEEFNQSWKDRAKQDMQRAVVITEIFRLEDMRLTNKELEIELLVMANEFEMDPQELLTLLKKNESLNELHFRAISRKVTDFLTEHANVKEVELSNA
jgi:trigger factor